MIRKALLLVLAAAAVTAIAPAAFPVEGDIRARDLPSDFDVLKSKSIFSRDHALRRWDRTVSTASAPGLATRRQEHPVLVGIVVDTEGPVAVLEMPGSGKLATAHLGEAVGGSAGGTIVEITLDNLKLAVAEGQTRTIAIGQDIRGEAAMLPSRGSDSATGADATTGTSTTTSATSPASSGGESLLERMRRRRQQELNR